VLLAHYIAYGNCWSSRNTRNAMYHYSGVFSLFLDKLISLVNLGSQFLFGFILEYQLDLLDFSWKIIFQICSCNYSPDTMLFQLGEITCEVGSTCPDCSKACRSGKDFLASHIPFRLFRVLHQLFKIWGFG
jgi:hypothetical protein